MIHQTNINEKTLVIVLGPFDDGGFKLSFFDHRSASVWESGYFSCKASATEFHEAIKGFYTDYLGSAITVDRHLYDINLVRLADDDLDNADKIVFTITLLR